MIAVWFGFKSIVARRPCGPVRRHPITEDTIDEIDETFTVDGTVTSGNTTNTDPIGTVTITDNDASPTVTIADATVDEGAGTVTLPVTIDTVSSTDVVVDVVDEESAGVYPPYIEKSVVYPELYKKNSKSGSDKNK